MNNKLVITSMLICWQNANEIKVGLFFCDVTFINFNLETNHSEFERMLTFGCVRMPGHYFLGLILSICFVAESYFPNFPDFLVHHYCFHYDSKFFNVIHCFSRKIILRKLFSILTIFSPIQFQSSFFQTGGNNFSRLILKIARTNYGKNEQYFYEVWITLLHVFIMPCFNTLLPNHVPRTLSLASSFGRNRYKSVLTIWIINKLKAWCLNYKSMNFQSCYTLCLINSTQLNATHEISVGCVILSHFNIIIS